MRSIFAVVLAAVLVPTVALAAGDAGVAPAAPAPAKVAEPDVFQLELKVSDKYTAGTEGTFEVKLEAKGVYHVNDAYPVKFKAPDTIPEGTHYPKLALAKADGEVKEKTAVFKMPFTVDKAGKARVGGTLVFSVCSEAQCKMEKRDLSIEANVVAAKK